MAGDRPLKLFQVPLSGKWRPKIDGTQMGEGDFQTLTNMRYTDAPGIRSISGMTKINTAAVGMKSGIHFTKQSPVESHVLVHSGSSGYVYDNQTAIPTAGDFDATTLWSSDLAAGTAKWSLAPDNCVAFADGVDTCIWGGRESRVPAFIISNAAGTIKKDYTDSVNYLIGSGPQVVSTQVVLTQDSYMYIGCIRPIKGIKFYVAVGYGNSKVAGMVPKYWNGTAYAACTTVSDGTAITGGTITLGQGGTLSFDSTVAVAKPSIYESQYLYWYQITFTGADMDATIESITLDAPFQKIVDIWDGNPRGVQAFFLEFATDIFTDVTYKVFNKDYNVVDVTTYVDIGGMSATQALYAGFAERMTAIEIGMGPYGNSQAAVLDISYWNGTAWVSVGTLNDLTKSGTITMANPGWVSWNPPSGTSEFKKSMSSGPLWYFYKITVNNTLSTALYLDYIFGIPAQTTVSAYALVATWQNRLVLVGEVNNKKNSLLIGSYGSVCFFNGSDCLEITGLGDANLPTAVGSLFSRYTGSFYDTLVILKGKDVWILDGTSVRDYRLYKLSDKYGCVAGETFKICPVGYEVSPGIQRHVAIWQTATGIVMFDGSTITPIDEDIRNYFDQTMVEECITAAYINQSSAFVDEREREYHWLFYSGSTAVLEEIVYSTKKKGWFKVNRGSIYTAGEPGGSSPPTVIRYTTIGGASVLTFGIPVTDQLGEEYVYGGCATGYLVRLEYGTTFDGDPIVATFKTRDIPFKGWDFLTVVRKIKLITAVFPILAWINIPNVGWALVTSYTTGTITISHFGDTGNASKGTLTCNPASNFVRVMQAKGSVVWGNYVFHSFQASISTDDVSMPFEPIGLSGFYQEVREDF